MKPYKIAIFFSGVERSLANTGYNSRVSECRAAAYTLLALDGVVNDKPESVTLSDVSKKTYLKHKESLPEILVKRAEHWYGESERVEAGVEAWREGDIERFGQLIFESGRSSIVNYEAGSPELIRLYEILTETDGVYGGRFSGAGFKGCCMAFINPDKAEEISKSVREKYIESFPSLESKFAVSICDSFDGIC